MSILQQFSPKSLLSETNLTLSYFGKVGWLNKKKLKLWQ